MLQEFENCNHFTHYATENVCWAYESCINFSTETCLDCVSGDADCPLQVLHSCPKLYVEYEYDLVVFRHAPFPICASVSKWASLLEFPMRRNARDCAGRTRIVNGIHTTGTGKERYSLINGVSFKIPCS